jgi:quercetin dioxygenase-like cupin family protein
MKMPFHNLSELEEREVLKGIRMSSVCGEKVMVTFFEFEPNAIVPEHKHPNEQISVVLEGEMEFTLGEERRLMKKGDIVVIPSELEHSARILEKPTRAIDAWYPIREDYRMQT